MKQRFLLLAMLTCSLAWNNAKATETEPNDTKAQANTLALNSSDNGAITPAGEVDWWKVTTNKDGQLNISWTSTSGSNVSAYLYDNDGVTLLNSGNTTTSTSFSKDGLAVGTYYVRMQCFYGNEIGGYSLSNTLTLPPVAIDVEPNGTIAQALTFPLNSPVNGHIGYYYNNQKDTFDWYKVTTNVDGRLKLTMQSLNGSNVSWYLYAGNGTTQLAYGNTTTSSSTNSDGLAAGTYYVRVQNYYTSSEWAPYTFTDSLFPPTIVTDVEPNGTRAQAKTLPVNNSRSGHIGYSNFYALRDTFDWYKVTTVADGRLQLTLQSFNGQNVSWYLYDNDGTTQLSYNNTTSAATSNKDGLAAGTYYVRVNNYYGNEFASYTLTDSLFSPAQANDTVINDTKEQALTLSSNSTVTGHIGYYYNQVRDVYDWYKVTLPADGNLQLSTTSNNGQNVSLYLYDNDGTTQLNYGNSASSQTLNTDGLQAGTYYVRINNYYGSEWAPYTLTSQLQTYTNTSDPEPNGSPYQAKTLPANTASTGHVNFYYNLVKDGADWFKINYTGSGALTLNMTQEAHKSNGAINNFWVYVYKDTTAGAIAQQYSSAASWSMNLSSLTQGYYWVKINTYYSSEYASYSITPTFTQVNIATIAYNNPGTIAAPNCDSTNTAAFKCAGSNAPYTVQLFRFGVPYGSPRIVNNTNVFSFTGLPNGSYLARVFGDGATGTAYGAAPSRALEPVPGNAATGVITATSAKVTFDNFTCVDGYRLQHRKVGDNTWIYDTVLKSPNTLRNLAPATQYEWQVVSGDTLGTYTAISELSSLQTFTTLSAFASTTGDNSNVTAANTGAKGLITYPNPTSVQFKIQYNSNTNAKLSATLKDMNGRTVWSKLNVAATAINGTTVDVSKLQPGIYILQVAGTNNSMAETRKIVVSR